MRKIYLILLCCIGNYIIHAQYQIGLAPRVSPDKSIYQKIGYTEMSIRYGSPSVKGRTIWGELEPYDTVWRAGANEATTIELSTDIYVSGKKLKAGKYGLFVIPRESSPWIISFNGVSEQWGAFDYDAEQDSLRIEIAPRWHQPHQEDLSYAILQDGYDEGLIRLSWEKMILDIPFETDYLNLFMKEVETRAAKVSPSTQWVVYLQGADFLVDHYPEHDVIPIWLEKSLDPLGTNEGWNTQYYPRHYIIGHHLWASAKYAAHQKDFERATKLTDQIKALEGEFNFYQRNRERHDMDNVISGWAISAKRQ